MAKFKEKFPDLSKNATYCTDSDKGLENAIGETSPHFFCAHHRKKNLRSTKLRMPYDELLYATNLAEIERIRESVDYQSLTEEELRKLHRASDKNQFLLPAVINGAKTYGRVTSQGVEANNSAIEKGRCLDMFNSI